MSAYTRPADKPRWTVKDNGTVITDNDVVNATSGENNVSTPPSANQDLGWDFQEYPPRQWDNWFKRIVSKWVPYLDQEILRMEKSPSEIVGLELSYSSASYVLIKAGRCGITSSVINKTVIFKSFGANKTLSYFLLNAGITPTVDTWYYFFACQKDDGTQDFFADSSPVGANLNNVDYARRLGAVLVNSGGDIEEFFQTGNTFLWKNPAKVTCSPAGAGTKVPLYLTVPKDINAIANVNIFAECSAGVIGTYRDGHYGAYDPINEARLPLSSSSASAGAVDVNIVTGSDNLQIVILNKSATQPIDTLEIITRSWTETRENVL